MWGLFARKRALCRFRARRLRTNPPKSPARQVKSSGIFTSLQQTATQATSQVCVRGRSLSGALGSVARDTFLVVLLHTSDSFHGSHLRLPLLCISAHKSVQFAVSTLTITALSLRTALEQHHIVFGGG